MANKKKKVFSIRKMVGRQIEKVLARGQRFEQFDQIRQRHFWSTYLFPYGQGVIPAGQYDVFKIIAGQTGQGYPTDVPLTIKETNWKNSGRVPDNQNFAITEIGVTVQRPAPVFNGNQDGTNIPATSVFPHLNGRFTGADGLGSPQVQPRRSIAPDDASRFLYGTVLEMQYLTNNVPLGLCADFSQSAGVVSFNNGVIEDYPQAADVFSRDEWVTTGDPTNGTPAAAFRRKLEVPILLQHGETMGMRLNIHRDLVMMSTGGSIVGGVPPNPDQGGAGWLEARVDWFATESFVEYS
jgi:hypothetical protein